MKIIAVLLPLMLAQTKDVLSFDYVTTCNEITLNQFSDIVSSYLPTARLAGQQIILDEHVLIDTSRAAQICLNANRDSPRFFLEYVAALGDTEFYKFFVWDLTLEEAIQQYQSWRADTPGRDNDVGYIELSGHRTVVITHDWKN